MMGELPPAETSLVPINDQLGNNTGGANLKPILQNASIRFSFTNKLCRKSNLITTSSRPPFPALDGLSRASLRCRVDTAVKHGGLSTVTLLHKPAVLRKPTIDITSAFYRSRNKTFKDLDCDRTRTIKKLEHLISSGSQRLEFNLFPTILPTVLYS